MALLDRTDAVEVGRVLQSRRWLGAPAKLGASLRPRHSLELSSRWNFGPHHTGRCSGLTQGGINDPDAGV